MEHLSPANKSLATDNDAVNYRARVGRSLLSLAVFLLSCRRSDAPTSVAHESDARSTCVDPLSDLEPRQLTEGTVLRNEQQVDLDADGARDPIVTRSGHCGSGGCNWQVYRTNHGCAKWAGSFFGDVRVYLSSRHSGLLDLEVSVRGGWYELDDYHFDGADARRTIRWRRTTSPRSTARSGTRRREISAPAIERSPQV